MINDDQITALAREYAEWVTQQENGDKAYIPAEQAIASAFLHWLCDRYALVEKGNEPKWIAPDERLPEIRERVLICEKHPHHQYAIFIGKRIPFNDGWEWNQSTKESVIAWMPLPKYNPELAKEVEK